VPHHLQQKPWLSLITSAEVKDQLVLTDSAVVDVLCKFEDRQYIHTYISGTCTTEVLKFELPRYQLEFALQGGKLMSLNYRGYQLASNQQLASTEQYTLPNFTQYLVLERSLEAQQEVTVNMGQRRTDTLVLIPAGSVTVDRSMLHGHGLVHVTVSM
jgi:hypothetical protein